MRIHLIACGGAVMHNMTIALHLKGYIVTGSDDEIFDPAKSRLEKHGLLPEKWGWFPEKITSDIDVVILGMHAREDNPELKKAKELGLKIYSFPEYIYEQSKDKTRVVIGGSHGKTTITSMIMHVLREVGMDFDYMVGAQIEGFDTMVKLTKDAKVVILEGDEYLSSAIDRRPKFHLYKADIGLISGIAWDHINVFPTFDNYVEQFRIFTRTISNDGHLIYCNDDCEVKNVADQAPDNITKIAYSVPEHTIDNGITELKYNGNIYQLKVFGKHNLQNLAGAREVCKALGVSEEKFYDAISTFGGAARRLEKVIGNETFVMYKDFAHSPSKLKATTGAVKEQFPNRKLIACMELHTFSSLNEDFLEQYNGAMDKADEAYVYFNPHTIEHKKLKPITEEQVKQAFAGDNITVMTDSSLLLDKIMSKQWNEGVLLMMSSGNFDGLDYVKIGAEIIEKI